MPKKVDAEAQRTDIAAAVLRLVARSGVESVSLREVAHEAGVSMGRVQHYFRSKQEMLLHGVRLATVRMEERITARLSGLPVDIPVEQALRAMIDEVLGDDPETRQVIRVSVAYYARAQEDPEVARVLFGDDPELRRFAELAIRKACAEGRAPEGIEPAIEAEILWSLVDSLGTKVAFGQLMPEQARVTIAYHLRRLFGSDREES